MHFNDVVYNTYLLNCRGVQFYANTCTSQIYILHVRIIINQYHSVNVIIVDVSHIFIMMHIAMNVYWIFF